MKTITKTIVSPESLQVLRDGYLDDEYYDAIWAEKRAEAWQELGRRVIARIKEVPQDLVDGAWVVLDHVIENHQS